MIFLADISQKVRNIHRANVLRILAKPFFSLLQASGPGKEVDRLSIALQFRTHSTNYIIDQQVSSFKFKFINEQQQKAIFFVEKHIWDNVKKNEI